MLPLVSITFWALADWTIWSFVQDLFTLLNGTAQTANADVCSPFLLLSIRYYFLY